jgi:hypothetical protein
MGKLKVPKKSKGGSGNANSSLSMPVVVVVLVCALGAGSYFVGTGGSGAYSKPFSLGKILDIDEGLTPSTGKFAKSGSKMWKHARDTMMKNPDATLIHTDPDVFLIKNLVTDEECDRLLALFDARKASAIDPRWCFAPPKYGDLGSQGGLAFQILLQT